MYVHVCQPHLSEQAEVVVEFSSSLRLEDISVGLVNVGQALLRPEGHRWREMEGRDGRKRGRGVWIGGGGGGKGVEVM